MHITTVQAVIAALERDGQPVTLNAVHRLTKGSKRDVSRLYHQARGTRADPVSVPPASAGTALSTMIHAPGPVPTPRLAEPPAWYRRQLLLTTTHEERLMQHDDTVPAAVPAAPTREDTSAAVAPSQHQGAAVIPRRVTEHRPGVPLNPRLTWEDVHQAASEILAERKKDFWLRGRVGITMEDLLSHFYSQHCWFPRVSEYEIWHALLGANLRRAPSPLHDEKGILEWFLQTLRQGSVMPTDSLEAGALRRLWKRVVPQE